MTTFTSLVAGAFGLTVPDDRPLLELPPGARCAGGDDTDRLSPY
jgi:hypothetical protein